MPGMNGAELLTKLHETQPEAVRFVLSGHAEQESVMRAVPITHQFFSKPCERDALREAVTRALELQSLLKDERAQRIIGGMDSLPSLPEAYTAVVRALANPEIDIPAVAAVIEADMAMSAKLLQLVNSAFFGLGQPIADVCQAATYLGLNTIRDLVLSIEVFKPCSDATPAVRRFLADLQARSTWTGCVARQVFEGNDSSGMAFTAGMLHDIGMLVMATRLPEPYADTLANCEKTKRPLHVVEQETFGVSHAEIGAYLLGVWGLPYPILEAAAYHHRPSDLTQESFSPLTAVHVASSLVASRSPGAGGEDGSWGQVDYAYLDALGVRNRFEEWEAMVDEELAQSRNEA
jgi:HD-like signal output (HDOD) protein